MGASSYEGGATVNDQRRLQDMNYEAFYIGRGGGMPLVSASGAAVKS